MSTALERAGHAARRVGQTVIRFDNGWSVLRQIATSSDDLTFVHGDLTITCPNVPGARVPVFEVFTENEYDLDWFTQGLPEAPRVVDVGAHVGCFSLAFTRRFPAARIDAYEPTPSTGEYLERNVAANGRAQQVRPHHQAVSARSGVLVMADNGAGSGHNGVLHLGEQGARSIEVECVSLADAVERAGGHVDLLKMDAEGAEYGIVADAEAAAWGSVDRVVMEYHPLAGHTFEELVATLAGHGLELLRREPVSTGLGLAWFSRQKIA